MKWSAHAAGLHASEITTRIIRNPNYGGKPSQVPGCCILPIKNKGVKPKTRQAIQDDIAKNGVRNPILVYKTVDGLHLSFGGGRLMACQELDTLIPAIVVDYTDSLSNYEEVTPENWQEQFTDVPKYFEFDDVGILTHYGLERSRNDDFDPAGIKWTEDLDDDGWLTEESPWL